MKHNKLILTFWLILSGIIIGSSSYAQTDNYSCNVTCLNQPSHVMQGVKVDLYNSNNQLIASTFTDDQAFFNFENLNVGESYTAKFEYNAENTYVDLEDAFAILGYILGFTELNEYQLIAADVDGNNVVNHSDFLTVLIDHYIFQQPFPVGEWILPDWEFTLDANKATGGPAGVISSGNVQDDDDMIDKSIYNVQTNYQDIISFNGLNTIKIPVYFDQEIKISGIALIAEYNKDLFEIVKIESPIEDINYNVNNGEIRMAWTYSNQYENTASKPIANIYLKQKAYSKTSVIEKINIQNESHILDIKGNKVPFIGFTSNEFKTATMPNSESIVFPNPCKDHFFIRLDSGLENAEYTLYNSLGQIVDQKNIMNNTQQIEISTRGLEKGIYYYHINYQSKSITGPISIQ